MYLHSIYSCTCNAMSIEFTCVQFLIHLFAFPWLSSSVLGIYVSETSWGSSIIADYTHIIL